MSKSTTSLERAEFLLKQLQKINQTPPPRTILDIELERRFFEEFVPLLVHPRTGLPIQLYQYEKDAIHRFFAYQISLWFMGRQVGKTSTAGMILAFLTRELRGKIVISSFRWDQSIDIIYWTKEWCRNCKDEAYADNIINDATHEIITRNHLRIIAMPRGHAARGKDTIMVVTDESQLIDTDDLSALLPTGLTTRPKRLHMGTAWGMNGWFWTFIQNADARHYALTQITSQEALSPNGPVLQDQLDLLRQEIGEPQFQQECLLIPIPDIATFFGEQIVGIATKDYAHPSLTNDSTIIIGWDHAVSSGDESIAYIAIYDEHSTVLSEHEVRRWFNTSIHDQVQELAQAYPEAYYVMDATAEGGKIAQDEAQRKGLNVRPVDFGKAKSTLMITHKNRMQQGLFKFQDEKTRIQHLNYKFSESETVKGRYKYGAPGVPDDRVDAAALADYLAFQMMGQTGEFMVGFGDTDQRRISESAGLFS